MSDAFKSSSLNKYLIPDVAKADGSKFLEAVQKNRLGEKFCADRFPKKAWGQYPDRKIKPLPPIFDLGGFMAFSAECAEVLRSFDLGKTTLHPVEVFQHDQETRVTGEYFCINFAETKKSLIEAESSLKYSRYSPDGPPSVNLVSKDDDIALDPTALESSDLWIEENLRQGFFLSDALAKALKAAKQTRGFRLARCRIIETP